MVPARTPPAVVAALNKAVRTALADPVLVKTLAARGATVSPTSPDELGGFLKTEIDRWGVAIRRSGAQVD
jgi:tripartite-type tricarboxylate transporter receptor subunit TctC